MDQNVAALVPLLPGYFGWNLTRTKCLASLIIVLIKVRTANFAQLATALPGGALKDSKYKRALLRLVWVAPFFPSRRVARSRPTLCPSFRL